MTSRQIVRNNRRRLICSKLEHKNTIIEVVDAIRILPAELRATCILDLEEFLIDKNIELVEHNSWWSNINLNNLWESLRRNSLA